MIVRDVPDIDIVLAGIRHHHERGRRPRLPPRSRGRRHPAGRPDPRGRRRVLRHDDVASVPQGSRRRGGAADGSRTPRAPSSTSAWSSRSSRELRPRPTPPCPATTPAGSCGCRRAASRDRVVGPIRRPARIGGHRPRGHRPGASAAPRWRSSRGPPPCRRRPGILLGINTPARVTLPDAYVTTMGHLAGRGRSHGVCSPTTSMRTATSAQVTRQRLGPAEAREPQPRQRGVVPIPARSRVHRRSTPSAISPTTARSRSPCLLTITILPVCSTPVPSPTQAPDPDSRPRRRCPPRSPTPKPTILPTSLPSVLPTSLPTLLPTARPSDTPSSSAAPTPTVQPTGCAEPSSSPAPSASASDGASTPPGDPVPAPPRGSPPPGGAVGAGGTSTGGPGDGSEGGASGSSGGQGQPPELTVPMGNDGSAAGAVDLAAAPIAFSGGAFTWAVPGMVLAVPGLLVVLAVGLQVIAGAAWLPVVRRRLGGGPNGRGTGAGPRRP